MKPELSWEQKTPFNNRDERYQASFFKNKKLWIFSTMMLLMPYLCRVLVSTFWSSYSFHLPFQLFHLPVIKTQLKATLPMTSLINILSIYPSPDTHFIPNKEKLKLTFPRPLPIVFASLQESELHEGETFSNDMRTQCGKSKGVQRTYIFFNIWKTDILVKACAAPLTLELRKLHFWFF